VETGGSEPFYRRSGFGTRIGFGERPALLVIDMARAFCDPRFRVGADQTPAVEAIATLLGPARAQGVPVYYTIVAYLPSGVDGGTFVQKIPALRDLLVDDPDATEIDPRIAPLEDEVVLVKKYPSAFFHTHLVSMLIADRIDTVIVTGCSTSGCIRATAVDAVSYGYRVAVPVEAVSDRWPEPHEANLFDIDAKYGDVVPAAEVVDYLLGLPAPVGRPRIARARSG
jgi:nicotinamidase-related amidase